MKRIDPNALARDLRKFFAGEGGDILEIGAQLTALADRATRMVRHGQRGKGAHKLAKELRAALEPILESNPQVHDLLLLINPRTPEDAKMAAAERLVSGEPGSDAIAQLLEAIVIAHEPGKRHAPAALRYGIGSERFRSWLRTRLRERRFSSLRDEHPRPIDAGPAETSADHTTPEDIAAALARMTAGERQLAEHLGAGLSLAGAARAMGLTDGAARTLYSRLRRHGG